MFIDIQIVNDFIISNENTIVKFTAEYSEEDILWLFNEFLKVDKTDDVNNAIDYFVSHFRKNDITYHYTILN